jgi:hypothetical protein
MSTKTIKQRIALVAVAALGAGLISVAPANAGSSSPIAGADNLIAETLVLSVATKASVTGSAVSTMAVKGSDVTTNRSIGLLYKDTSTGTAQSATVLSTGALAVYTLADTDVAFVASGGAFSGLATSASAVNTISADRKTVASLAAATSMDVAGVASLTWSSSTAGTYQISLYRGTAIDGTSTATAGTLVGLLTVTVAATSVSGAYSAADSICVLQASHAGVTSTSIDDASASKLANAAKGYVTVNLKDAYGVALAAGALVATATNGAFVSLVDNIAVGTGSTAVSAAAPTDKSVVVSQPTANAPVSTTVTVTYNGVTVCTKSLVIVGEVASMKASSVLTGALNGANATAFKLQTFDSAGNLVVPRASAAFAGVPASLNATVSAASISAAATMMTGDTSAAYSTGTFTCGATAGTKSINIAYQNASGTVAVSPAIPVRCGGNAYSYSASFDKASYVQGEIATLTVQFKDAAGNNANSYGTTGAASAVVTSPMLTMIGTPVVNQLPDVNGQVKHKFTVGGNTAVTAGSYNALVDYPTLVAAESATIQTIGYKVSTGGSSVTNEDVLKSIVALIASINKQIQALQKLILKR